MGNILSYLMKIDNESIQKRLDDELIDKYTPDALNDMVRDEQKEDDLSKAKDQEANANNTNSKPSDTEIIKPVEPVDLSDLERELAETNTIMTSFKAPNDDEFIRGINDAIMVLYIKDCKAAIEYILSKAQSTTLKSMCNDALENKNLTINDWNKVYLEYLKEINKSSDPTVQAFFKGLDTEITNKINYFKSTSISKCQDIITDTNAFITNKTNEIETYCTTNDIVYPELDMNNVKEILEADLKEIKEMKECIECYKLSSIMTGNDMIDLLIKTEQPYLDSKPVIARIEKNKIRYEDIRTSLEASVKERERCCRNQCQLNKYIASLEEQKTKCSVYIENMGKTIDTKEYADAIAEVKVLSENNYYKNIEIDTKTLDADLKSANDAYAKYTASNKNVQSTFISLITEINALISKILNTSSAIESLDTLKTEYESILKKVSDQYKKYLDTKSNYDQVLDFGSKIAKLCEKFNLESQKVLTDLITKSVADLKNNINEVNQYQSKIKTKIQGWNTAKHDDQAYVLNKYSSINNYPTDIKNSINSVHDQSDKLFDEYKQYYISSEGNIVYRFNVLNQYYETKIKNAQIKTIDEVEPSLKKSIEFITNYKAAFGNLEKLIADYQETLTITQCKINRYDEKTAKETELNNYTSAISNNVSNLNSYITKLTNAQSTFNEKLIEIKNIENDINNSGADPQLMNALESYKTKDNIITDALENYNKYYVTFKTKINEINTICSTNIATITNEIKSINDKLNQTKYRLDYTIVACNNSEKETTMKILDSNKCITETALNNYYNNNLNIWNKIVTKATATSKDIGYADDQREVLTQLAIAFDRGLVLDNATFQPFLEKQVVGIKDKWAMYYKTFQETIKTADAVISRAEVSNTIVQFYYNELAPIHDPNYKKQNLLSMVSNFEEAKETSVDKNTQLIDAIKTEKSTAPWQTQYNNTVNSFSAMFDVFSNGTDEYLLYSSYKAKLDTTWKTIKSNCTASTSSLNSIKNEKSNVQGLLDKMNTYNVTMANLSQATSSTVKSVMDLVSNSFTEYKSILARMEVEATKISKYSAMTEIETYNKQLVEWHDYVTNLANIYNTRKYHGAAYNNAATIISYLYCSAWVGRNRTADMKNSAGQMVKLSDYMLEEFTRLLNANQNKEDDFLVFEKLCIFTPILPLIWPNSSNINDRGCWTGTGAACKLNKEGLRVYIRNQLPTLLRDTFIRANKCSVENTAMIRAIGNSKDPNNAINAYCEAYKKSVFLYKNDADNGAEEFFKRSLYDMEGIYWQGNTLMSIDPIHLWSKVLLYLSGKDMSSVNPNSFMVPTNYPCANSDYDRYEAVMILLNRFFNQLGVLSYNGKAMTETQWISEKLTVDNLDAKASKIQYGGMCFGYTDTQIFTNNYHIDKYISFSLSNLKQITEATSSAKINTFLTSIVPYVYTNTTVINGSNIVSFRNPTAITDFLFNDISNDKFGFEMVSVDNYRHETKDEKGTPKSLVEVLDTFIQKTIQDIDQKKYDITMLSSVQLACNVNYKMALNVFKYIYETSLNWKIKIPIIDYTKIKVATTNNMYPISKINTVTYATSNLCFYDMFK